jgi:Flp pilus assembly pilin Flp
VQTGAGSTAGVEHGELFGLGGVALVAAGGVAFVATRRRRTQD